MKYVTAQRVRSSEGEVGINAFVYTLENSLGANDSLPDFDEISPRLPDSDSISVMPGGNFVESYFDLLVVDLSMEELQEQLDSFVRDLPTSSEVEAGQWFGERRAVECLRVRFAWTARIPGSPKDEAQALAERMLRLFDRSVGNLDNETSTLPIDILASSSGGELAFELDQSARDRVVDLLGEESLPNRVKIDREMLEMFEHIHGSFYPHVADLVLPTDIDSTEFGGVRILNRESGEILWQSAGVKV